jgi:hypothetical protein
MKLSVLAPALCALFLLTSVPACGGDDTGDGDGDGDGDTGTGATGSGGAASGGAGTGGGSPSGGTDGSGGNGPIIYGSGTMAVDFNGVRVNFEVYISAHYLALGYNASADSIDSDSVDAIGIAIEQPGVGTFDCSDDGIAAVTVQALGSDGETSSYAALGADDCTMTVTEYGAVGEPVRGTFSGTVKAPNDTAVLTNGVFDLIRGSDF